jgi:hypothetical protein
VSSPSLLLHPLDQPLGNEIGAEGLYLVDVQAESLGCGRE